MNRENTKMPKVLVSDKLSEESVKIFEDKKNISNHLNVLKLQK